MEHPSKSRGTQKICVIVGASHGGVGAAFALRQHGWTGQIILFDSDPTLPYHRPPLSKTFLTKGVKIEKFLLKPVESYQRENIELRLGHKVTSIDADKKNLQIEKGIDQCYDYLIIATGARPYIPPINGIEKATDLFPLRSAHDASSIWNAYQKSEHKSVVIVGGGYIGLECAAALKKSGAEVTVLEKEERLLARVTSPIISGFFEKLHVENEVNILTDKKVTSFSQDSLRNVIHCSDGTSYKADLVIVGVGIKVNQELAQSAGLEVANGIKVDASTQASDSSIYAIGDCTNHYNARYKEHFRLECVQNAVDQAKVAAANICGKSTIYDSVPWFWSDQYDVKLQMAGISKGCDQTIIRNEPDKANCFSAWHFKGDQLMSVDAINHPKAYMLGTKFIKSGQALKKKKLADPLVPFKPQSFIVEEEVKDINVDQIEV